MNAPKIKEAGPTEVDFAKNRFEREMLEEHARHHSQKEVAIKCFTTALDDFPLHSRELRRLFSEAVRIDQDDAIQVLLTNTELSRGFRGQICRREAR